MQQSLTGLILYQRKTYGLSKGFHSTSLASAYACFWLVYYGSHLNAPTVHLRHCDWPVKASLSSDWFIVESNQMSSFYTPSLWLASERLLEFWLVLPKANSMPPESRFSFRFLLQALALQYLLPLVFRIYSLKTAKYDLKIPILRDTWLNYDKSSVLLYSY